MRIKDLPEDSKPREKFKKIPSEFLDLKDLIAIILGRGTKNYGVLKISENISNKYDIDKLREISLVELQKIKGVGEINALKIKAALELGSRRKIISLKVIRNAKDVFDLCKDMMHLKKEQFVILLLDTKNQLIKKEIVSIGTLNLSIVHPREVFKEAIKESANSVIMVHNHPSGDPTPSDADIKITKQLIKAGELLDIKVLDHVIIGKEMFSFHESKLNSPL
jgi:DNA repair protein RadC